MDEDDNCVWCGSGSLKTGVLHSFFYFCYSHCKRCQHHSDRHNVVNNVNAFTNRLDKYWTNRYVVYDYKSDLTGTVGLPVMLFEMRAERISCARNITLDWMDILPYCFSCSLFSPWKRGSMFLWALVCVCVCLSVTTITKKIVDGFVPNFMGRFLGEKGRPSSCFVTIGRGMWK